MLNQRTIKALTRAVGVGVHSGQRVELTLRPAPPDTGVVFRRVDLDPPVDIPVSALVVSDTRMASTISAGGDPAGAKVQTIEHPYAPSVTTAEDMLVSAILTSRIAKYEVLAQ